MSTVFGSERNWEQPPPPPPPAGAGTPPRRGRRRRRRAAAAAILGAAVLAGLGAGWAAQGGPTKASGKTASATLTLAQLEAKVDPAVVDVVSTLDYGSGEAAGTGIVLSSSGEVLTNNHVVEGATGVKVTDVGNGRTYSATVVGYSAPADVAVLQLRGASGLTTATLGNSSQVARGESVVAFGNAGGLGGTPSTAAGTITALGQSITAMNQAMGTSEQLSGLMETDANIQEGDSGGPLVDMSGEVVGMDTAASSSFQFDYGASQGAQGYAIPINKALSIARQIQAGHASSTVHIGASAFLGVQLMPGYSYSFPGLASTGARVGGVVTGSPAAKAGLSAGDTITSVGGRAVSSASGLRSVMDLFHPGQRVKVTWVDMYGAPNTTTLTLATGPTG